jgi:trehalose-phosphatase
MHVGKVDGTVVVRGSQPAMGSWEYNHALIQDEPGSWRTPKPLVVPRGATVRYKYAIVSPAGELQYEPIEEERELVVTAKRMTIGDIFGDLEDDSDTEAALPGSLPQAAAAAPASQQTGASGVEHAPSSQSAAGQTPIGMASGLVAGGTVIGRSHGTAPGSLARIRKPSADETAVLAAPMRELRAAAAKHSDLTSAGPDEGVMTGVMVHHEVLPSVLGGYMRHRRLICVTLSLPVILRRLPGVAPADGSAGAPRWSATFDSDNFLARGPKRSVASTVEMVWVGMVTQDCFDRVTDKEQPRRESHTSQDAEARMEASEAGTTPPLPTQQQEGSASEGLGGDTGGASGESGASARGAPQGVNGISLGLADSLDEEPGVEDLLPVLSFADRVAITHVLSKLNCVPIFLEDVAAFEAAIQAQNSAARSSPASQPRAAHSGAGTPVSDMSLTPAHAATPHTAQVEAEESSRLRKQAAAAVTQRGEHSLAGLRAAASAPGPQPEHGLVTGTSTGVGTGVAPSYSSELGFGSAGHPGEAGALGSTSGLAQMDPDSIGGTLDRVAGYRFTNAQPNPAPMLSPEGGAASPGPIGFASPSAMTQEYDPAAAAAHGVSLAAHAQQAASFVPEHAVPAAAHPVDPGASNSGSHAAAAAASAAAATAPEARPRGHSRAESDPATLRVPDGPVRVSDSSVADAMRTLRRFAAYLAIVLGPNLHNVSEVGDLASLIDYGRIHSRPKQAIGGSSGSLSRRADADAQERKSEEEDKLRAGFGRLHVDEMIAVAERGWRAYRRINQCFAQIIQKRIYRAGDVVWTHDFWLCLLPAYLAHICRPAPSLIYFMHAPFPTSEIFRTLGNREELVRGLLAADVVGFHTFNHARHFLQVCKRVLGITYSSRKGGRIGLDVGGRDVSVTISHVGVDPDGLAALMASEEAAEHARNFRRQFPDKIVIAGLDSAGRLKGIALKLLAFERMLEHRRELAKVVVLVQLVETSALSLHGDKAVNMLELQQLRERINRRHGPVVHVQQAVSFGPAHRVGLFHCADVLFQTPVREGLTLMPLEYIFVRTRWQLQRGSNAYFPQGAGASKVTLAPSDSGSTPVAAVSGPGAVAGGAAAAWAPASGGSPRTERTGHGAASTPVVGNTEAATRGTAALASGAAVLSMGAAPDAAAHAHHQRQGAHQGARASDGAGIGSDAVTVGSGAPGTAAAAGGGGGGGGGGGEREVFLGGNRHLLQSATAEDVVDHMPRSYASIAAQTDLDSHRRQTAPPPRPAGVSGRLDPAVPEAANEEDEDEEDVTALTPEERRARLYGISPAAGAIGATASALHSGHGERGERHGSLGLEMGRHGWRGRHRSGHAAQPVMLGRAFSQPAPPSSHRLTDGSRGGAGAIAPGHGPAGRGAAGGSSESWLDGNEGTPTSVDTDTSATADASASDASAAGTGTAGGERFTSEDETRRIDDSGGDDDLPDGQLPIPIRHSDSAAYLPRSEPLSEVFVPNVPNVELLQAPLPPPDRSGCVVLSEFSTASHILNSTLRVNPYDVDQTARVLADAISMSDTDRSYRQWRDYRYTARNPAAHWSRRVLLELITAEAAAAVGTAEFTELEYSQTTATADTRSTRLGAKGKAADCSHLMVDAVAESFRGATRRVLFVDYGGTLIAREGMGMYVKHEFVGQSRSARTLPPEVLADLGTLASEPHTSVVLFVGLNISAGDAAALADIPDLTIALENSAVVSWGRRDAHRLAPKVRCTPVGAEGVAVGVSLDSFVDAEGVPRAWVRLGESADFLTGALASEWSEAVGISREVMETYRWRVNGSLLRESGAMLTWDYADADPEWGQRQANDLFTELRGLLQSPNVSVDRRRTMVEVSPASVTKGTLAQRVLESLSADEVATCFALAVGDDSSDEDVFKAAHSFLLAATRQHEERQAAATASASSSTASERTRVYSVRVGRKHTEARYFLGNVNEVREMVAQLAATV